MIKIDAPDLTNEERGILADLLEAVRSRPQDTPQTRDDVLAYMRPEWRLLDHMIDAYSAEYVDQFPSAERCAEYTLAENEELSDIEDATRRVADLDNRIWHLDWAIAREADGPRRDELRRIRESLGFDRLHARLDIEAIEEEMEGE